MTSESIKIFLTLFLFLALEIGIHPPKPKRWRRKLGALRRVHVVVPRDRK